MSVPHEVDPKNMVDPKKLIFPINNGIIGRKEQDSLKILKFERKKEEFNSGTQDLVFQLID